MSWKIFHYQWRLFTAFCQKRKLIIRGTTELPLLLVLLNPSFQLGDFGQRIVQIQLSKKRFPRLRIKPSPYVIGFSKASCAAQCSLSPIVLIYTFVLFQSLIAVAMVLYGTIDSLIDFFSFTAWIFYGGAMLALIVMRHTKPHAPRPYKVKKERI